MSNVTVLPNARAVDTALDLIRQGHDVDPATGEVRLSPSVEESLRRENLRRIGDRNPPPTLSPEALGRVRDDLRAGRFKRTPTALHQVEDAMHESGFPGPGGSAA